MMTQRNWYIGWSLAVLAAAAYAAHPRYDWRNGNRNTLLRIDRWTGVVTTGEIRRDWGRWVSTEELQHDAERKAVAARDDAALESMRRPRPDISLPAPCQVTGVDRGDPLADIRRALAEDCVPGAAPRGGRGQ
jgi:hypothetical protein